MKPGPPMLLLRLALVAFLISFPGSLGLAEEKTRILFVGNSYTAQIRSTLTKLIQASPVGASTEIEFITPGGKTLAWHLENPKTTKAIREGDWDFVVLQDQSQTPAVFPGKFESAARDLGKLIDSTGAKTVFYQTWGRRDGDKQNPDRFPTYESMQEALSDSYRKVARRSKGILAPVGDTWARVRESDPDLGRALYKGDGSHPSAKGAYLASCVFYLTLFGKSPADVDFRGELSEAEAAVILEALESGGR